MFAIGGFGAALETAKAREVHDVQLSKFLSKLLRHSAVRNNVLIDRDGWALLDDALRSINDREATQYTEQHVREMVSLNDKKRFELREGGRAGGVEVRATGGHTIKLADQPFGTALDAIRAQLIQSRSMESLFVKREADPQSLDAVLDSSTRHSLQDDLCNSLVITAHRRFSEDHGRPLGRLAQGKKRSSVHTDYVHKLRVGVHHDRDQRLSEALADGRARAGAAKAEILAAAGKAKVTFGNEEDVPVWQQGDLAVNTAEAFAERQKLRTAPLVVRCQKLFWEVTLRSVQGPRTEQTTWTAQGATRQTIDPDTSKQTLDFKGYRRLMLRIYKCLMDDYDPEDAEETIKEDWEDDSKGANEMTEAHLFDALFELTDLWVPTISEKHYADFLYNLLMSVSVVLPTVDEEGKPQQQRFLWKHLKECAHAPALAALPTVKGKPHPSASAKARRLGFWIELRKALLKLQAAARARIARMRATERRRAVKNVHRARQRRKFPPSQPPSTPFFQREHRITIPVVKSRYGQKQRWRLRTDQWAPITLDYEPLWFRRERAKLTRTGAGKEQAYWLAARDSPLQLAKIPTVDWEAARHDQLVRTQLAARAAPPGPHQDSRLPQSRIPSASSYQGRGRGIISLVWLVDEKAPTRGSKGLRRPRSGLL